RLSIAGGPGFFHDDAQDLQSEVALDVPHRAREIPISSPFWNTSLSAVTQNKILIRGYRVQDVMQHCSFGDVVYRPFRGELPSGLEGRIVEMILTSSTDHAFLAPSIDATRFAASGGVPLQASIAAGIITLGDHHGGAIEQCAQLLQESIPADVSAEA